MYIFILTCHFDCENSLHSSINNLTNTCVHPDKCVVIRDGIFSVKGWFIGTTISHNAIVRVHWVTMEKLESVKITTRWARYGKIFKYQTTFLYNITLSLLTLTPPVWKSNEGFVTYSWQYINPEQKYARYIKCLLIKPRISTMTNFREHKNWNSWKVTDKHLVYPLYHFLWIKCTKCNF